MTRDRAMNGTFHSYNAISRDNWGHGLTGDRMRHPTAIKPSSEVALSGNAKFSSCTHVPRDKGAINAVAFSRSARLR